MGTVTIITNRHIAKKFLSLKPANLGHLVCLTPDAQLILKQAGHQSFFLLEEYTNLSHAKTAFHQYNSFVQLKRQLSSRFEPYIVDCISAAFWWLSAPYFRIYYSLKSYDSFNYHNGKSWQYTTSLDTITSRLFALMQARKTRSVFQRNGLFALPFYKFYNHLLLNKIGKNKFVIITQDKRKLPKIASQLGYKVIATDFEKISFAVVKKAFAGLRKSSNQYSILPYPTYFAKRRKLKADFNYKLETDAFAACRAVLEKDLNEIFAYRKSYAALINHRNAAGIISDYISGARMLPFCANANKNNIAIFLINHGSHTPHKNSLASLIDSTYAQFGRVTSPYAKYLIARNPLVAELAHNINPNQPIIKANLSKVIKKHNTARPFTILHAGNFSSWDDHVPWITETAEEFLSGIKAFAAVIKTMPNCRLIIRVKGKKSFCNADVVRSFIELAKNIEIRDDAEFYTDLANADLLVAANSNTIHEALENKIPVLLYSYRNRYHHCAPDDKTVYAVNDITEVRPMLEKIMQTNYSEEDFNKYAWDDSIPTEKELCQIIAANLKVISNSDK